MTAPNILLIMTDEERYPPTYESEPVKEFREKQLPGRESIRDGSLEFHRHYAGSTAYNLAWLRQEENQYLATPREVAQTLPVELLRLMGYPRGAYALGYIDDLRDPIIAVLPGSGDVGFAITD